MLEVNIFLRPGRNHVRYWQKLVYYQIKVLFLRKSLNIHSKLYLSMAGQLLMLKRWPSRKAGGHITNNIITNILNFIYQWLGNCWCWRGDYPGRVEVALQYSNFDLSLTGKLLVVKGWLLGEAGGHLTNNTITNILNFIYQCLGNCWCWRGDYPGRVEVTLQYSNFHLSLTGKLLVVKGWLLGELEATFQYSKLVYCWLGNC